jgi:arsenite methyltransferase
MGNLLAVAVTTDLMLHFSSLAIHNISSLSGREKALNEAVRVLKPGGKLIITDFRHTQQYAEHLRKLGLDWRFWYGGPWTATKLVSATKAV